MEIKEKILKFLRTTVFYAILTAIAAVAVIIIYIFLFYLQPVFSDQEFNYIKVISDANIKPASEIKYEISLKNTGFREINDLTAVFNIPNNTSFVSSSAGGQYFEEEREFVFKKASFLKGEAEKIVIILAADKPLDNNTIIKGADLHLKYSAGNEALEERFEDDSQLKIISSPSLKLGSIEVKDIDGGDVSMGDYLKIDFEVENFGDMNSKNLIVSALIPEKTKVNQSTIEPKNYKIVDGSILWAFPVFEINKKSDFSFKLNILEGFKDQEEFSLIADIKSDESKALKSQSEVIVSLFPDLSSSEISLVDADGGYLWAGDKIIVSAVIENSGEKNAEGAEFVCPIPQYTSYINESAKCEGAEITIKDGAVIFKIDKIGVGEKKQAEFALQVLPSMTGGGKISTDFSLNANGEKFNIENIDIDIKANFKTTIVCMGDSLVAISNWPEVLDNLLEAKYPRADFNTISSGIRGEIARNGYSRFDSSVAIYRPQIVIIGYGTNDVGGSQSNFSYYLNALVGKCKNIGVTPMVESLGYINTSMEPAKVDWPAYQNIIYQVGASNGVPVIDVYTPLAQNPGEYLSDWVHYTPEGSNVVGHTVFNYVINYLDEYGRRK